jgi:hypothetical protein
MIDNSGLKRRYTQILDTLPAGGRADGADERRNAPRVPVASTQFTAAFTDLGVKTLTEVRAKDISTTGVCFFSDQVFPSGAEIDLSVAKVFSLTAIVVSCEMEETDATFLEVRYRVRCRFVSEKQGMEILVLAKEAEAAPPDMENP